MTDIEAPPGAAAGRRGGRRKRGGDRLMVPEATFTSYYGRPIVKPSPWEADIPAYLFAGGLAAGSSLVAAGAQLTNRPTLRRSARLGALGALTFSMGALVHDLGRPMRFLNMLRVAKLTSPMSVGTWILSLYAPFAGTAAATELVGMLPDRYRVGPLRLAARVDGGPGLDEERRIAYVAVTRPRERLYLTLCRQRRIGARGQPREPSRFLRDLPVELVEPAA